MTDPAARTERLVSEFRRRFGGSPQVCVRAPGRVPLMGSHTDYNDGFVVPAAIDRDVRIAASPRADATVRLYSLNFDQSDEFRLSDFAKADAAPWSN
ncbi:MAG: galactokinase, partial [Armatimonadetes bacterium]|nr:galactokinase [Armatimonadota bacterium]